MQNLEARRKANGFIDLNTAISLEHITALYAIFGYARDPIRL